MPNQTKGSIATAGGWKNYLGYLQRDKTKPSGGVPYKVVQLSACEINDDDIQELAKVLENNHNVYRLELAENQIGDRGVASLAHLLTVNFTITQIYLRSNQITQIGVEAFVKSLASNTVLTELNLKGNPCENSKQIIGIENCLKNNRSILLSDSSDNNNTFNQSSVVPEGLLEHKMPAVSKAAVVINEIEQLLNNEMRILKEELPSEDEIKKFDSICKEAEELLVKDECDRAIDRCNEVLKFHRNYRYQKAQIIKDDAIALLFYKGAKISQSDPQGARKYFDRVLEHNPSHKGALQGIKELEDSIHSSKSMIIDSDNKSGDKDDKEKMETLRAVSNLISEAAKEDEKEFLDNKSQELLVISAQEKLNRFEKQLNELLSKDKNWQFLYEELEKLKEEHKTADPEILAKFREETKITVDKLDDKNKNKMEELQRKIEEASQQLELNVDKVMKDNIESRDKLQQQITQIQNEQQPLLNKYWQEEKLKNEQNVLKENPDPAVGIFYKAIELQLGNRLVAVRLFSTGEFKANDTEKQTNINYAIDAITNTGGFAVSFFPVLGPFLGFGVSVLGYIFKEIVNNRLDGAKEALQEKVNEGLGLADIDVIAEYFARKLAQAYKVNFTGQSIEKGKAKELGDKIGLFIYQQFEKGIINIEKTTLDDILISLKDNIQIAVQQGSFFSEIKETANLIICGSQITVPLVSNQAVSNQSCMRFFFRCCNSKKQLPQSQPAQSGCCLII